MKLELGHKQKVLGRVTPLRRAKRYGSLGASLGLPPLRTAALIDQIHAGFPFKALQSFSSESGMSITEIAAAIGVPERTLARRRVAGRFSSEESERLLRLSNVFEKTVALFEGSVKEAAVWLRNPKKALDGKTPLSCARTEIGARQVEELIGSLEQGVFA